MRFLHLSQPRWLTGHDLALAGDLNFAVNLGNFAVRKSDWFASDLPRNLKKKRAWRTTCEH